jgi:beta-lactamase regulating signal transducer with metallopeptidase domain/biopolymer transport protein ExbD
MIPTPTDAALALSRSMELSLLAKATAMLLIGLTAATLARRTRASVRHLLLTATFGTLLVTPIIGVAGPETAIAIPIATVPTPVAAPVAESVGAVSLPASAVAPAPTPGTLQIPWRVLARLIWLAGLSLFLVPVVTMLLRLRALRRTSLPWPELTRSVQTLAGERGFRRSIDVLRHEGVATPITFGVWRPVILMPTCASEWGDADLRRALVHEVEHVLRRDWAVHLIARGVTAVYWFHPLAWIAWRQLALQAERSCDDAVIANEERTDYADQLVMLAQRLTATPGPALGMAHRTDLAARITALLDETRPRGRAGLRALAVTIATAALIVVGVAPLRAVAVNEETTAVQHSGGASRDHTERSSISHATRRTTVTVPASYAKDHRVLIGDEAVSIDALVERWRKSGASHVILRGDGRVLLQDIIQVMDRLKEAGVEHVAIVDQPEKPRRVRALDRELLEAAEEGDLDGVKDLIDAGANVDASIDGDGSPLIVAARANRLAVVVELLNRGADVDFAVSGDGNPLIVAAAAGAEKIVDLLLTRGAAIDLIVPGDENALIQAAGAGHFAIVKMLVDRGADVNARVWVDWSWHSDKNGTGEWRTPLSQARKADTVPSSRFCCRRAPESSGRQLHR